MDPFGLHPAEWKILGRVRRRLLAEVVLGVSDALWAFDRLSIAERRLLVRLELEADG